MVSEQYALPAMPFSRYRPKIRRWRLFNLPPRMIVPYLMIRRPSVICHPFYTANDVMALLTAVLISPLNRYPFSPAPQTLDSFISSTN